MALSVVYLNVNGIRENKKRLTVFNIFKHKKYDMVFLQETHCQDENESKF
jgi:exonuclease III